MKTKKPSFVPVWQQLLNRAKETQGSLKLSDPIVAKIVEGYENRFVNYVYGIKKCAKLECIAIRQGKTVIGYEIPALRAALPAPETTETTAEATAEAPVEGDAIAADLR